MSVNYYDSTNDRLIPIANKELIYDAEIYSTEEQEIGVWTDGKPLYKRTFYVASYELPAINTIYYLHLTNDTTLELKEGTGYFLDNTSNKVLINVSKYNDAGTYNSIRSDLYQLGTNQKIGIRLVQQIASAGVTFTDFNITIKYTKTTDSAVSSNRKDLNFMMKPNLWTPDTEYDFGNGVYGQRKTGTITAEANTVIDKVITADENIMLNIINSGGWFCRGEYLNSTPIKIEIGTVTYSNAGILLGHSTVLTAKYTTSVGNRNRIRVAMWSNIARNAAPYDVWFLYTKEAEA